MFSTYQLLPNITTGIELTPFVQLNDIILEEDIQDIIDQCSRIDIVPGNTLSNTMIEKSVRISDVGWVPLANDTIWIYDLLSIIVRRINGEFYKFDLFGFSEPLQYTIYNGNLIDGGHYTWHQDSSNISTEFGTRKLTLVVQLSHPYEYEGGDLEILYGDTPHKVDKKRGTVIAFPSWQLHRVTPTTAGIRKSLVVWITGPSWR